MVQLTTSIISITHEKYVLFRYQLYFSSGNQKSRDRDRTLTEKADSSPTRHLQTQELELTDWVEKFAY